MLGKSSNGRSWTPGFTAFQAGDTRQLLRLATCIIAQPFPSNGCFPDYPIIFLADMPQYMQRILHECAASRRSSGDAAPGMSLSPEQVGMTVTLRTRIQERLGCNLGWDSSCSDPGSSWVSSVHPHKFRDCTWITQILPLRSLLIHYCLSSCHSMLCSRC